MFTSSKNNKWHLLLTDFLSFLSSKSYSGLTTVSLPTLSSNNAITNVAILTSNRGQIQHNEKTHILAMLKLLKVKMLFLQSDVSK